MLKSTSHDGAKSFRLQLEGRLATAWVTELEQCWKTAASTLDSKGLLINLDDVTFVDGSGMALLADMHRAGAKFTASTPYQRELVAEITGEPMAEPSPPHTPWLRKFVAAFFLLTLLLARFPPPKVTLIGLSSSVSGCPSHLSACSCSPPSS